MNTNTLLTSAQTIGPFFAPALLRQDARRQHLSQPETLGQHIRIEGYVFDGDRLPVPDALVEIWQANAAGRYHHPSHKSDQKNVGPLDPTFLGYGRSGTDETGLYWFETIKPGPVPFDAQRLQAPHLSLTIFARGLLNHLFTRLYFPDEPSNASDPILHHVPEHRRHTLLAQHRIEETKTIYRLDIILQGPNETAFFTI